MAYEIPKNLSPDDCAERAVMYAAVAAFRASEKEGAKEAADVLDASKSTLSGMWMDFMRKAAKP